MLVEHTLIIGALIWFVYSTIQRGMIFGKWQDIIEPLGEFWSKPLGTCIVCFGFWFGLIACFVFDFNLYCLMPAIALAYLIQKK